MQSKSALAPPRTVRGAGNPGGTSWSYSRRRRPAVPAANTRQRSVRSSLDRPTFENPPHDFFGEDVENVVLAPSQGMSGHDGPHGDEGELP